MGRKRFQLAYYLSLMTQIGLTMVLSALFGVWLGRLLDARLGTRFLFTGIFLILGVAGGITVIFRLVRDLDDDSDEPDAKT